MLKKIVMVYVGAVVLVAGLWACNPAPIPITPPPSTVVKDGYSLDIRGGTINFGPSAKALALLNKDPEHWERIRGHVFEQHRLSIGKVSSQSNDLGINLYYSLKKDQSALTEAAQFRFKGPGASFSEPVTYAAGQRWDVASSDKASGSGAYTIQATVGSTVLENKVEINTDNVLAQPSGLKVQLTTKSADITWSSVAGARSYLVVLYSENLGKTVWSQVVNSNSVGVTSLSLFPDHQHLVLVSAFTWDSSKPQEQDYPAPLPNLFNSSLLVEAVPITQPKLVLPNDVTRPGGDNARINKSGTTGQNITADFQIRNEGNAPLQYSLTAPAEVQILSAKTGSLKTSESTRVQVQTSCSGPDLFTRIQVESNDPERPKAWVPVSIECQQNLEASRVFWLPSLDQVRDIAWSPDGTTIATGGAGVLLWNAQTGAVSKALSVDVGNDALLDALSWSPDSHYIAVANGSTNQAVVFDTTTGSQAFTLNLSSPARRVAWSPQGNRIAVSSGSAIEVFNTAGASLFSVQINAGNKETNIAWNPAGTRFAVSGFDNMGSNGVFVYDASSGNLVSKLVASGGSLSHLSGSVAWSPDGQLLATSVYDLSSSNPADQNYKKIAVWNTQSEQIIRVIGGVSNGAVLGNVAFSPDGTLIASSYSLFESGATAPKVNIYNTSTGNLVGTLNSSPTASFPASNNKMMWNPSGSEIAILSRESPLNIWNIQSQQVVRSIKGGAGPIVSLDFDRDSLNMLYTSYAGGNTLVNLRNLQSSAASNFTVPGYLYSAKLIQGEQKIAGLLENRFKTWSLAGAEASSHDLQFNTYSRKAWAGSGKKVGVVGFPTQVIDTLSGQRTDIPSDGSLVSDTVLALNVQGSRLLYSGSNTLKEYEVSTGNLLRNSNYRAYPNDNLHWIENSSRLLSIGGLGNLVSYDLEADAYTLQLEIDNAGLIAASPDGRYTAVSAGQEVRIISLASGVVRLTIPSPAGTVTSYAWSSNGQYLAMGTNEGTLEVYNIVPTP
jgi:WD40 repeat protein